MVDAPCVVPSELRSLHAARTIPFGSRPGSVQKERFSADTTAFCIEAGICESGTLCRFWTAKVPSTCLPSE